MPTLEVRCSLKSAVWRRIEWVHQSANDKTPTWPPAAGSAWKSCSDQLGHDRSAVIIQRCAACPRWHEFPRSFLVTAIIFPHTKWLKKNHWLSWYSRFKRCMHLKPQKTKVHLFKVYGELLFFFSFLPGLHIKTIFILGVAILLLVVIALYMYMYVDHGSIPTTARKSGIAETSFLQSSSPTPSSVAGQHHVPEPSHSLFPSWIGT